MLGPSRTRLVRFGAFELDLVSGDLWRAGRRVRLQNQPRHVLKILVARRGELVSRDELRRELWPDDTFVDFDNGLNVAIRKIRGALGDVAPSPRFIETERAQGYRFIAPVTDTVAPDERVPIGPALAPDPLGRIPPALSPRSRSRVVFVAAVLAIVLAASLVWLWPWRNPSAASGLARELLQPVSLAVLPLSGAAGPPEELLAVGIADGIISRLSNVSQFRVRPTSAVARFRARPIDAAEAGRRLDSQYVLAGTMRTTEDRVRVSVQLVSTADGSPIWGQRYDVARGDLLRVEDAVADEIAAALRVEMSGAERERFYRRYTRSGAAYERYLMGRARLRAVTEKDARQAIVEFEAARDLDPMFAPAYAGLAAAAAQLRVRFASLRDAATWDARAREEAGRALLLDPDLAEAHVALAAVYRFQEYDWDTVIRESRRALELNPSLDDPHLYLAVAYFHVGLLEQAEDAIDAARQLNPENRIEPLEILGAISLFAGRPADAVRHLSQARTLSDSRIVRYMLGWAHYYTGDPQGAEAMLAAMIDDDGPVAGNARATLAAIWAARGATAEARALAERVAAEPDLLHHAAYGLATAYAQLGEPATALRWLTQATTTGFSCYPWFERDPLLDPIRGDAGFAAFARELRRSWDAARAKYADA